MGVETRTTTPTSEQVGDLSEEATAMEIDGFRGQLDHRRPRRLRHRPSRAGTARVDRRPRLIARCSGTADVAAAVRFARDHDLEIAVRGGATTWPAPRCATTGSSSTSRRCGPCGSTPPAARPWVQGGALWGDVDHETQAHGLATTGGIVGHTGVAGLTLGGGLGFLMRKHGLTIDNLVAAEVVTAEGSIVRASADEHPDLFWALRGGGGNFGVVTSFRFALHPVGPTVMAGPVFWAADDTTDVLRFYRDFTAEAPDELGTVVRLGTVPPLPVIPEDLHWRPAIAVACCYAGAVEDGERAVRALRRLGTPLVDLLVTHAVRRLPGRPRRHRPPRVALLLEVHEPRRPLRRRHRRHRRSRLRRQLAPVVLGDVPHGWRRRPSPPRRHRLRRSRRGPQHHHRRRVAPDESGEHAAAETAWARRFLQALQPHRAGSVYVNSLIPTTTPAAFERPTAITSTGDSPRSRPSTTPTTPSTTTRTSAPMSSGDASTRGLLPEGGRHGNRFKSVA
mgnify:CR=1 FL=1